MLIKKLHWDNFKATLHHLKLGFGLSKPILTPSSFQTRDIAWWCYFFGVFF